MEKEMSFAFGVLETPTTLNVAGAQTTLKKKTAGRLMKMLWVSNW